MGSRLSRQNSLDNENFSRRRRKHLDSTGESDRSGDFLFTSLMLRSDKLPGMLRRANHSPYVRRVAWIREIQKLLRERKREEATDVLKLLRKDLGLEGTSLNDILYKNAAFLNLVDPISHELLLSLAKDMQCPKKDSDTVKSSDKICRQLIYHLTPHSKWLRKSMTRRKAQACLKTTLQKKLCSDSVDLSGIPLSTRDIRHVAYYLQTSGGAVISVDLSFTELRDEGLRLLLPFLGALPKLTTVALNGNRLTLGILKDLTEALKDSKKFSCLAWIDLGNNVDIFTMPQPLLVALRRRCSLKSSLPTIYEYTEGQPYCYRMESSIEEPSHYEEEEDEDEEEEEELEPWSIGEQKSSGSFTLHHCER
ncbi:leucine-rich repeat-containing protein 75B isoform X1 [Puntigrus tetrazona]|uniref:leucine-rich repeat-containing protein 75B isoform X1 n=1 Tax=Puntigrus tetrazona TaxID=1606681 RepID=UPI001C8AEF85|nr:leucine-rich repeat-containing protein 75B isoform X1 [Puntigrus tetrazona]